MRKNTMRLVLVALTLITTFASTPTRAVMIRGVQSCGVWVNERGVYEKSWLLGYLSGLAIGRNIDFIKNTDSQSLFLWVDNYCRGNPLRDMSDAADALVEELINTKRLK